MIANKGGFIAIAVLLVGGVASAALPPLLVWGGVFAVFLGVLFLNNIPLTIFSAWIWATVKPLVLVNIHLSIIDYVDELFVVLMLVQVMGAIILGKRTLSKPAACILKAFLILIVIMISSFFVNSSPAISLIQNMLTNFRFLVLYFLVDLYRASFSQAVVWRWFVRIVVFQIGLNFLWAVKLNPLYTNRFNPLDFSVGTFDNQTWMAYYIIAFVFLALSAGVYKSISWRKAISFAGLGLLQFILTFSAHAYLYLAMLGGVFLFAVRKVKLTVLAVSASAALLFLASLIQENYMVKSGYAGDQSGGSKVEQLRVRAERFQAQPKMLLIKKVCVTWLTTDPLRWIIGYGPGNGASVVGRNTLSPGAIDLLGEYYMSRSGLKTLQGGSIIQMPYSGILSIWSELGFLGFVLYFYLFFKVGLMAWLKFKTNGAGEWTKPLSLFLMLASMLFVGANFLAELVWMDYFTYGIWFVAAVTLSAKECALNEA